MELYGSHVQIEKDKNRYFFLVMMRDYSSDHLLHISPWCEKLPANADNESIGRVIQQGVGYIYENCGKFDMNEADKKGRYEKYRRIRTEEYCGYTTFERRNVFGVFIPENDGSYTIYSQICPNSDVIGLEYLPADTSAAAMGYAVYKTLAAAVTEKRKKIGASPDPYPPEEIGLFGGGNIIIFPPRNRRFSDMDDCHSMDCYKFYGFSPKEDSPLTAAFFLTDAPELGLMTDEETIVDLWGKRSAYFSDTDTSQNVKITCGNYGIFTIRSEKQTSGIHRISYFVKITDNDVLECGMETAEPLRRKKTDERLTEMFEEFVRKIRFCVKNSGG